MVLHNARLGLQAGLRTWIDGVLYADPADARVPATDHGLVTGDGVFEVLKVTDGEVFAVTRHLARLTRSAERLGLPEPDLDHIRRGVTEVCADLSDWDQPLGACASPTPPGQVLCRRPAPPASR